MGLIEVASGNSVCQEPFKERTSGTVAECFDRIGRTRRLLVMDNFFSVEEAQTKLYTALAETIGFKYLKSQRCLKKTVSDLVFEIDFYSSKWNRSGESVKIEASFVIMCKRYGKERINNVIAEKWYRPGPESGYWYDVSTQSSLEATYERLKEELAIAVDLCHRFETDHISATEYLFAELFDEYHVKLDFVAETLGIDKVQQKAKELYLDIPREDVETYQRIGEQLNSMLEKGDHRCLRWEGVRKWMINRSNWKYIMDNASLLL